MNFMKNMIFAYATTQGHEIISLWAISLSKINYFQRLRYAFDSEFKDKSNEHLKHEK